VDRPLRIALLTYRGTPHSGGQGVYTRQLSRALAALGHSVEVFSGQPYPDVDEGVRLTRLPSLDLYRQPDPFRVPRRHEFRDAVDALEFAVMCTAGYPEPLTFSLRAWRALRHRLDLDVVHDNQCLGYGILGIARRIPVIATIHHPITVDVELNVADAATRWQRFSVRRWYRFTAMQVRVARRIPHIVTPSDTARSDVAAAFGIPLRRIATTPLGADTDVFRPLPHIARVPGRIVTTASADIPLKGLGILVTALHRLRATHPDAHLIVIGSAREGSDVPGLIERLRLHDAVRFRSGLETQQIAELYAQAQVAVVPSLYEGFSLPAVEAMASGVPLLATRGGALPDVVGGDGTAGLLVDPGDPEALRGGLARLLDDAPLRERLARGGRERALRHFTWEATARATEAQYRAAIAERRTATAKRPQPQGALADWPAVTTTQPSPTPTPPAAERRPVVHEIHGDRRVDEYAWLRDRDDPAVIAHLTAENAYTDAMTAGTAELRQRIYEEIAGRVQQTDESAPVPHGPWRYSTRTVEGMQYPIMIRRPRDGDGDGDGDGAAVQVILDQNALAGGHDYLRVGDTSLSPDHRLLAYTVDTDGSEQFTLRIRDLDTGEDRADTVDRVYYSLAWSADGGTVFYTCLDESMRPWQVWRHRLGTAQTEDTLVYQEDDDRFFAEVSRTRSGRLILISLGSHTTREVWMVDADRPDSPPRVVAAREQGHEYEVDHHGDTLYIVSNDGAVNFRLMTAPLQTPERRNWRELIPHRDDVKLDGIDLFAEHMVLYERAGGVRRISHGPVGATGMRVVPQPEEVYVAAPGSNREWNAHTLRFEYSSLITPRSAIDHDMRTGARTVVKEEPVLGGYDRTRYVTERLWATAGDGTQVPISLVRHRDTPLDGTAPALLYGYGSYEISTEPSFAVSRLSLLDRGVIYAIAHVRGGGEMGRRWYDDGKLMRKRNTFTDFIACADHLVSSRITSHQRLGIRGGSAGGLLIGAVVNLRPDVARVALAHVPFVDVVTTMLDDTLPLTVIEYEEWGNPNGEEAYRYMLSYSPYDNVAAVEHPAVLATGGLNDPRVGFWEPAKWVARLRERSSGTRPILLQTEMGAGHGGPSGRYHGWRKEAYELAFLLGELGVTA
jgi:oligopeptidase B